jgi:hypothetical protein
MEDVLMGRWLRHRWTDDSGIGVISAVIVGLVVFTSGATWISMAMHQGSGSAGDRDRERAFGAAEAAVHQAMSQMSFNPTSCPTKASPVTGQVNGVSYRWWIDQTQYSCAQVDEPNRYIVAQGWVGAGPNAPGAKRRQVEQQIKLKPLDGFKYALFASPGGISASQKMDLEGDVYSAEDFTLANNSNIKNGGIVGQQGVTINGSKIDKDIWSVGDIKMAATGGHVLGDVKTSGGPKLGGGTFAGDISAVGTIEKKAIAPGTIALGGTIKGGRVKSAVTPPPKQTMPAFDPLAVTYSQPTWTTAKAFNDHLTANRTNFTGIHRVTNTGTNEVLLSGNPHWTVGGELVMVVADGLIRFAGDLKSTNVPAGGKLTLAVISLSGSDNAIRLTNQQTFPSDVSVLLFAPNGCVNFENLKTFSGAVYAKCITSNNQMNLTYLQPTTIPGVDWTTSSATRFEIEAHVFREVVFQP